MGFRKYSIRKHPFRDEEMFEKKFEELQLPTSRLVRRRRHLDKVYQQVIDMVVILNISSVVMMKISSMIMMMIMMVDVIMMLMMMMMKKKMTMTMIKAVFTVQERKRALNKKHDLLKKNLSVEVTDS